MPAAAISVHSADAVDCELFNLDLFQDAGLFAARFNCHFLSFHGLLLFVCFRRPFMARLFVLLLCNADAN